MEVTYLTSIINKFVMYFKMEVNSQKACNIDIMEKKVSINEILSFFRVFSYNE